MGASWPEVRRVPAHLVGTQTRPLEEPVASSSPAAWTVARAVRAEPNRFHQKARLSPRIAPEKRSGEATFTWTCLQQTERGHRNPPRPCTSTALQTVRKTHDLLHTRLVKQRERSHRNPHGLAPLLQTVCQTHAPLRCIDRRSPMCAQGLTAISNSLAPPQVQNT